MPVSEKTPDRDHVRAESAHAKQERLIFRHRYYSPAGGAQYLSSLARKILDRKKRSPKSEGSMILRPRIIARAARSGAPLGGCRTRRAIENAGPYKQTGTSIPFAGEGLAPSAGFNDCLRSASEWRWENVYYSGDPAAVP